jgi:16S rRNA (guanine966-N2)-methyltransferase
VAPKGQSTRPTSDRAREAIFNVIVHAAWAPEVRGRRVLDLFAGSGALGLEALSRGASYGRFVDRDRQARAAIEANLAGLGETARGRVSAEALPALGRRAPLEAEPFDVVFLDPPYGEGLADPTLTALVDGEWLAREALIIIERGARERETLSGPFERLDDRMWGAARVDFLKFRGG